MARPFVLEVSESVESLEKSLKQAKSSSHKERLQILNQNYLPQSPVMSRRKNCRRGVQAIIP